MKLPSFQDNILLGPWIDDPDVSNDQLAYRRLIPRWVVYDKKKGIFRVSSGAFPPHKISSAISVTLGQVADKYDIDVQTLSLRGHELTHGLAAFEVGAAREIGFKIRLAPTDDNPAHALLFAEDPETGNCPDRKLCQRFGRELGTRTELLVLPPGVDRPSE